jgi:hypothetical protein
VISPSRAIAAVRALLDAAIGEMDRHDRADLATRLRAERERLDQPSCTVLVIGEFNKGKSSMVNALLNARVCATDADVATAVPTLVRYADELCALAHAGEGAEPEPLDPAEVETLVSRTAAERAAGTERVGRAAVASVEIGLPRGLLRDGLVLVDTPGMGGGLNSAHGATTLRALAGADAVVFVTDASQELSAAELELLRRATELCGDVGVAVTKIDFYPEWRRIVDIDRGHLRRAGLDLPVLPLSAPIRHVSVRDGDRALAADSGFPHLAAFLRITVGRIRRAAAAGAAAAAHSALSQLVSELATAQEALADPASRQERLAQWTEAKQRAEQLRSATSRWQVTLADRIGDMSSAVDYDITTRLRAVRREAAERLSSSEPREWVELEPWLYERTNDSLAEHLKLIREHADQVADDVAERFGDAAWELRVAADVGSMGLQGTVAGEEIGLAAAAATRASRAELAMGLVRGGSIGMVSANAAGLVIGAAIGTSVLVFALPIGAVLAGVLGKFTLRSARTAQLRMLRAEAERSVALYLDEIEVRARRDSRDAVRRVQQHLREVFAEHAAALHTATARNLEVVARSVQQDERGDRADLGKTSAELERVRALAAKAGAIVDQLLAQPLGQSA